MPTIKPEWHQYDKISKYLIQHNGDAILRLAGLTDIVAWKALQSEVVQPAQLPDGLIEARFEGDADAVLFLLEVATRAEPRLIEQAVRGAALVYLDQRVLPEVLVLVLHPKGNYHINDGVELESRKGLTAWKIRWRVVELWTLPADELLATGDLGLIPWVPLTNFSEPPEVIFQKCRERIDKEASADEHDKLLIVTRVLASLRYNDPHLLAYFGGKANMNEFPAVQELIEEASEKAKHVGMVEAIQGSITDVIEVRFGAIPPILIASLKAIKVESKLRELVKFAAQCSDLKSFETRLLS